MNRGGYVLGVSMSNHDRSACLLADGRVVGAIAEERLDRRKRSEGFYRHNAREIVLPPMRAIARLLRDEGIGLRDLELVVCGRSIRLCRDDLLAYLPVDPDRVVEPPLPGHHLAHAYSAYASSPYRQTAVLVIDEQGHWQAGRFERCSWFTGDGGALQPIRQFWGDRTNLSIGMFYNVFAALAGLAEAGRPAAGKLMSLAGLGKDHPEWPDLLTLSEDGDAGCDLRVLDDFLTGVGVSRRPGMDSIAADEIDELITKYRPAGWQSELGADLARKAQSELEQAVLHTAGRLRACSDHDVLAYAGGVALNCSANARLAEVGWRDVHVHPAATDDGTALGLAAYGWLQVLGRPWRAARPFNPLTGPRYGQSEVRDAFEAYGLLAHVQQAGPQEAAELVATGKVLCWYSGRSEWGPRALGSRSIVANPLSPGIVGRLNATIKFREPFRPFGISLPAETANDVLDRGSAPTGLDPYMLSLARPRHGGLIEVSHVDGTIRYQIVDRIAQPEWHNLISAVDRWTGLAAVVNTSFNTLGEPLVETPEDAVRQFLLSHADALWLDGSLVLSAEIPEDLREAGRQLAWSGSAIDPLSVAVTLATSGYPEAARQLLGEHEVCEQAVKRLGPDRTRRFHELWLHLAAASGEAELASVHAARLLDTWVFPPEVLRAASILARQDANSDYAIIGTLLESLGADSSALNFFLHMVRPVACVTEPEPDLAT